MLLQQESAQLQLQAPVLVLPGIFEPALCRTLMQSYQQHGGELSGFMREQQGKTVLMQDPRHKIRRDHTLHVHEAMPVTQGKRYVFLPFSYDEAAAVVREKNAASLQL